MSIKLPATPRSVMNTKQPAGRGAKKALQERGKDFTLLPHELVELRSRQEGLLLKLDAAIASEDVQSLYFINAEVMTLCHIFGVASPLSAGIGSEVLRGLREMRALAIPEESSVANMEAMKTILGAALKDAAAMVTEGK